MNNDIAKIIKQKSENISFHTETLIARLMYLKKELKGNDSSYDIDFKFLNDLMTSMEILYYDLKEIAEQLSKNNNFTTS